VGFCPSSSANMQEMTAAGGFLAFTPGIFLAASCSGGIPPGFSLTDRVRPLRTGAYTAIIDSGSVESFRPDRLLCLGAQGVIEPSITSTVPSASSSNNHVFPLYSFPFGDGGR
jgi:hypothetical protein